VNEEADVAPGEPIFTVTDRWGDEIVLTQEDWDRIVAKRPGVEDYLGEVRETLESPTRGDPGIVYEGRYMDTKVFYKKGLLEEDPHYKACYVCVVVRYDPGKPGSLRTVYFPYNMQAKLGNLLYCVERG
jgi:hypothetical protein